MLPLQNKNIALIICGGIAAYKSLYLIRRLKEQGANIFPVLTKGAEQFITKLSAASLSHNKVFSSVFEEGENDISHIQLAGKLDLIIVAPATAHKLAEISTGLAHDFADTLLLAATCPVLCAPAMNNFMFQKPAIKRAIELLKQDGIKFIGPNEGALAEKNCQGEGRMSEPEEICAEAIKILAPANSRLAGKKIVITAGATIEPIDPVRYISNYSSGKQAFAIAQILQSRGAEVTLIYGNTQIAPPPNIKAIKALTAQQMLEEVKKQNCDIAIFCAAVCDWRPPNIADQKLKKQENINEISLNLVKNPDIIAQIAQSEIRPRLVIGFAAETENHLANAQHKLKRKKADIIIANNVGTGSSAQSALGSDYNEITIISKQKPPQSYKKALKLEIAEHIADFIEAYSF